MITASGLQRMATITIALFTLLQCNCSAHAEDGGATSPKTIIYPGDVITAEMLTDVLRTESSEHPVREPASREGIVGKVARRTLLPGEIIGSGDVGNPQLVQNGAEVTIFYIEDGLTITTSALALQDGAVGESIRVRNSDTGVVITGTVQADGSIRVAG